jgi:rhamnosyltransferase
MSSSFDPKIAVLLATYNGAEFVAEQVRSILAQEGVNVHIFLSDDGSRDETVSSVQAITTDNLTVLTPKSSGSAAQNFIRLVMDADWDEFDFVCLADQDDIWRPTKLRRAVDVISERDCAAYASSVTAYWPDGREVYVRKSKPQRKYDYIFEAGGPGCTMVVPTEQARFLRNRLGAMDANELNLVNHHDWLFYSIFRHAERPWCIDKVSGLMYRQHTKNVLGASNGVKAKLARLRLIASGEYLSQLLCLARLVGIDNVITRVLQAQSPLRWLALAPQLFEFRREPKEAINLYFVLLLLLIRGPRS